MNRSGLFSESIQLRLTPAHVVVKLLMGRLQLVLALAQVAFALIDFLYVLADLAPVSSYFFSAGAALDIPAQLGAIFFQLRYIFLQVLAIFTNVSACLTNISHVLANLPARCVAWVVPYVMAKIPII